MIDHLFTKWPHCGSRKQKTANNTTVSIFEVELLSTIDTNVIYRQAPACHISADEVYHLMIMKKIRVTE